MNFKHLACLAAVLLTSLVASADIVYPQERADRDYNTTATEKLDRGVQNILFCWAEIPHRWWEDSINYNNTGFLKGTSEGVRNASVRLGQGLFDTFTFPWNTGNFQLPWSPPPNQVHPEWVPMIVYCIPGAEENDRHHQDWIDGWESQRDP